MKTISPRLAVLPGFQLIPVDQLEALAQEDWAVLDGDGDLLGLLAGPSIRCDLCTEPYCGDLSLAQLHELAQNQVGQPCQACQTNSDGSGWAYSRPWNLFPFGDELTPLLWPVNPRAREWILQHAHRVASLGLFVYRSDRYGCLVGIDSTRLDPEDLRWAALRFSWASGRFEAE